MELEQVQIDVAHIVNGECMNQKTFGCRLVLPGQKFVRRDIGVVMPDINSAWYDAPIFTYVDVPSFINDSGKVVTHQAVIEITQWYAALSRTIYDKSFVVIDGEIVDRTETICGKPVLRYIGPDPRPIVDRFDWSLGELMIASYDNDGVFIMSRIHV